MLSPPENTVECFTAALSLEFHKAKPSWTSWKHNPEKHHRLQIERNQRSRKDTVGTESSEEEGGERTEEAQRHEVVKENTEWMCRPLDCGLVSRN